VGERAERSKVPRAPACRKQGINQLLSSGVPERNPDLSGHQHAKIVCNSTKILKLRAIYNVRRYTTLNFVTFGFILLLYLLNFIYVCKTNSIPFVNVLHSDWVAASHLFFCSPNFSTLHTKCYFFLISSEAAILSQGYFRFSRSEVRREHEHHRV